MARKSGGGGEALNNMVAEDRCKEKGKIPTKCQGKEYLG